MQLVPFCHLSVTRGNYINTSKTLRNQTEACPGYSKKNIRLKAWGGGRSIEVRPRRSVTRKRPCGPPCDRRAIGFGEIPGGKSPPKLLLWQPWVQILCRYRQTPQKCTRIGSVLWACHASFFSGQDAIISMFPVPFGRTVTRKRRRRNRRYQRKPSVCHPSRPNGGPGHEPGGPPLRVGPRP